MKSEHVRKPSGIILVDGREVASTRQCVHCGCHWVWVAGSGKHRGFCRLCMGITCGRPECDPCVPTMQRIEEVEAGKRKTILSPIK